MSQAGTRLPQVQSWAGRTQLMGQLGPNKPFAYQMFSGAAGGPDVPYKTGGGRNACCQVRGRLVGLVHATSTDTCSAGTGFVCPLHDAWLRRCALCGCHSALVPRQVSGEDAARLAQLRQFAAQRSLTASADSGAWASCVLGRQAGITAAPTALVYRRNARRFLPSSTTTLSWAPQAAARATSGRLWT